ncbi:MAG: zf-HC2 domain-containing protein, partial [Caldicoprobacter oshimai]
MDCRQCRENISAYVDGMLDGSLISEMQQHLSECPRCRKEYTAILKVREMCAGLEDVELPSGFCSCLIDRLKGEESAGMVRKIRWRVNRRVVAGMAAAVVLVFGAALALGGLGGGGGAY